MAIHAPTALLLSLSLFLPLSLSPQHAAADGMTAPPEIGQPAPPLMIASTRNAPDDARFGWDDLRGRVVIVDFFATWCGGCVAAVPHANELVDAFDSSELQYLFVNNQPPEVIEQFLQEHQVRPWVLLEDMGMTSATWAPSQFPLAVMVNPEGIVVAITRPTDITEDTVRDVLAGRAIDLPFLAPYRKGQRAMG